MIPEEDAEFFDNLILNGAMEFAGVDENGEMLFAFTSRLAEVDPDLHQRFMSKLQLDIRILWMNGFIDMDIDEENPTVSLTDKAFDAAELDKVHPYFLDILNNIKRAHGHNQ